MGTERAWRQATTMKRVLCEGQTEETFVNRALNPHLATCGRWTTPILLATKRVSSGQSYRGGITSYDKIR